MNDPKAIWQDQPTEPSAMTLEKIRQKTQQLHAKTRRALLRGITVPLVIVFLSGYAITWVDGPVVRAVFAFAISWSLAGQYFLNRGMWSPAAEPVSGTGLESYRREVERRRTLSRRFLGWFLAPVILALAAFTAPLLNLAIRKGMLRNTMPFLVLLVIWIVSVFARRILDQRELRREIDELNATERTNEL
jgi:hypothetical protein